ncbi:MAG: hypothetical protein ACRBK7_29845 [Acidimicrobiales bacterium]
MPHQLQKPTTQLFVLVFGILLLTGFAFSISSSGLTSEPAEATSRLEVDGETYDFAATTCTITDTDFVASGPGEIDGEPFWVSASADRINLVVGEEAEVAAPSDESQVWLTSVAEVSWTADADSLTGSAVMRDERDTTTRNFRGAITIQCPPT